MSYTSGKAQSAKDSVMRPFSELLTSQESIKKRLLSEVQKSVDSLKLAKPIEQNSIDSIYTELLQLIQVLDTFKQEVYPCDSSGVYNLNYDLHAWEVKAYDRLCPNTEVEYVFEVDTGLAMVFRFGPPLANLALRQAMQIHLYTIWLRMAYCKKEDDEKQH
ncbi:MAG: hypothetical protein EP332_03650 [Bacteroidetes bacterium]|nr:MAG: hypothetical protein EP332_03650 [Bacteroidota bacterium]